MRRHVLVVGLLSACRSSTVPSQAAPSTSTTAQAPTASAPLSAQADAASSESESGAAALFYPLYEGACARSYAYRVGKTTVHRFASRLWAVNEGARLLFEHVRTSYNGSTSQLGDVGGIDEAHMWVDEMYPSRSEGLDPALRLAILGWKSPPVAEARDAKGQDWSATFRGKIDQPDGSLWSHVRLAVGSSGVERNMFMAWSASGERLPKAHLPGPDMAGAERLPSGELVIVSRQPNGRIVLRRWSPTAPVDDLPIKDITSPFGFPAQDITGEVRKPHVISQEKCQKCGVCVSACPEKFGAVMRVSHAMAVKVF